LRRIGFSWVDGDAETILGRISTDVGLEEYPFRLRELGFQARLDGIDAADQLGAADPLRLPPCAP
jgi:hypothetical protein